MSSEFSQTTRSLNADSGRFSRIVLFTALGVLTLWLAWFELATVDVCEVTTHARIEALPNGQMRVVANYSPSAAFGRIRLGQQARLRLDAFPWTQYGSVKAVVSTVASEAREGVVRVELELEPNAARAIPLSHGLPGTLEIDVERTTPAFLALQKAGRALGSFSMPSTPLDADPSSRTEAEALR